MFASGACGLVWQMVWTAQFGLALGHEIVAVLSVVAAFFGGISAGSFLLAQKLESSLYPGRWYAGLEALIAIWALLLAFFSPIFYRICLSGLVLNHRQFGIGLLLFLFL